MVTTEQIQDLIGAQAHGPDGSKIGDLEAVYVDTGTDQPSFATVKVGFVGRHRLVFVPPPDADVGEAGEGHGGSPDGVAQ